MIRVPLGDLKVAFSNPAKYAQSFKVGGERRGPTKYGMFLHAIGVFHKNEDLITAQNYLEEKLTKNFKNVADLPDYAQKLEAYVLEWTKQGNTVVYYRDNIAIPVPESYSTFTISGQASRVDLIPPSAYGIWMFGRNVMDWEDDPKMPLLQYTYAQRLDVSMDQIKVGIYDFQTAAYATRKYSAKEVTTARRALNELLAALGAQLAKKS